MPNILTLFGNDGRYYHWAICDPVGEIIFSRRMGYLEVNENFISAIDKYKTNFQLKSETKNWRKEVEIKNIVPKSLSGIYVPLNEEDLSRAIKMIRSSS